MKVLITSGGTEEALDGVRCITNFSSGKTGALIADRMSDWGAEVTLLRGHRAQRPSRKVKCSSFTSFRDLDEKLQNYLKLENYDAVIHLAAVSDYSVDFIAADGGVKIFPGMKAKLDSNENLTVRLKKNHKILNRLKGYAPQGIKPLVTGFKLTNRASSPERRQGVAKLIRSGQIDFAVHNDLSEINENKHPAALYSSVGILLQRTENKEELARSLFVLLTEKLQEEGMIQ